MDARANNSAVVSRRAKPDEEKRRELRYWFAHLLEREYFDKAYAEAQAAFERGEIYEIDLRFVIQIVAAAERAGVTWNLPKVNLSERLHSLQPEVPHY